MLAHKLYKQTPAAIALILLSLLGACAWAEPKEVTANQEHLDAESFNIRTYAGGPKASEVVALATKTRREAHGRWLADEPQQRWQPCCEIVVHSNRSSYLRAVGGAGGQTSGASLIKCVAGQIVERRVDVLVNEKGECPALAHELTHVVLADFFEGRQPPPWIDEGIATLADSEEKRALHYRDCHRALRNGEAIELAELLELKRLTSREQAAAFYGQSLSLVEFLADRGKPARLLTLVKLAQSKGYDQALRDVYDLKGIGELRSQWLHHAASQAIETSKPLASSR